MNYYIVGFMYCGKSTFGKRLAKSFNFSFIDLDKLFEDHYHYTIPRFFEHFGEQAFRQIETKLLRSTASHTNTVVATGGGTPCHSQNMDFILSHGIAIYLKMSSQSLVQRAISSHNPRPLMKGIPYDDLQCTIATQLSRREIFYQQSHIILNGENPTFNIVAMDSTNNGM